MHINFRSMRMQSISILFEALILLALSTLIVLGQNDPLDLHVGLVEGSSEKLQVQSISSELVDTCWGS